MNIKVNKSNLIVVIWLLGFVICFLFIGLIHSLVWSLACSVYLVFKKSTVLGVIFGLLFAAYLFLPQFVDTYIFDLQSKTVKQLEIRNPPIDLNGKVILFAEEAYNDGVGCRRACSAIVRSGLAKQVLFGVDRSVVAYDKKFALNLLEMKLYAYPNQVTDVAPIESKPVRVYPEKIDYLVVRSADKEYRDKIRNQIGHFGMGKPTVFLDYHIIQISNSSAVNVFDEKPLLSLIKFSRKRIGFPYVPGLTFGKPHRLRNSGANNQNQLDNHKTVLEFLCGPSTNPKSIECNNS